MTLARRTFALALAAFLLALPVRAGGEDARSKLAALGYLSEKGDAALAVRNFQTANALEATGALDAATLEALSRADVYTKSGYLELLAQRYAGEPLKSGMSGDAVRKLQKALIALGYYDGAADGAFGDGTMRAVMAFQTANGLSASGEADQAVQLRLYEGEPVGWEQFLSNKLCMKGDSGCGVRSLQRRLRALGYFDGEATASFGDRTQYAVQLFQRENALPESGQADDATCRLLYSGRAKSLSDDGVLGEGDGGEDVRSLQLQLSHLGYFSGGASGQFQQSTLVAVTFFQIASGLAPTGKADDKLLAALSASNAVPFSEAAEALSASAAGLSAEALASVAATASGLLGQAFPAGSDDLFPGFSFVQYAYAKIGVAIADPGQIIGSSGGRVFDAGALNVGEIVALERTSDAGVQMLFVICLGGGRAAYVDADTGFVVSGDIGQIKYDNAYVWNFRAA